MSVRIVRLGSPRLAGEGLRIGTVRRPPRGVPKSEYAKRDLYDVWLPNLAPSESLLKVAQAATAGDDYELLFAASAHFVPPVSATRLGSFAGGAGLRLLDNGAPVALPARLGWLHGR